MKGIILAAGRGSRLGSHTDDRPKSLLTIGGKTLIQRSIENLLLAGIDQVVVVVGYLSEMLEEEIAHHFSSDRYKIIYNPDYTRGSGSSLICAASEFDSKILLIESDLLYSQEVVKRLADPALGNALTMGHFNHGREEVKIYLKDGIIERAQWGKPDDKEATGDWVGFTHLDKQTSIVLGEMLRDTNPEQGKELNYEDFIFRLVKQFPFQAINIADLPWVEIDNEIDLTRAITHICPRL